MKIFDNLRNKGRNFFLHGPSVGSVWGNEHFDKRVGLSLVFEHLSEVMSHMISITMEVQQNEP